MPKMGKLIGDETLYTLFFAYDQDLIADDRDDSRYMLRKPEEEYETWGSTISYQKTEQCVLCERKLC